MEAVRSCYLFLLVLLYLGTCKGSDDECSQRTSHLAPVRLKRDLLCDYDPTVRPVVNHTNATTVKVSMILKFFTYDMLANVISVHDWLALVWKDEHLTWDPSKYDSLSEIHISADKIWVPDLSVYNRNDQSGSPNAVTTVDCVVTSIGTVVCVPPGRHDALCMPDLTKYPLDTQNCSLRFGSWVHSGEEIDFKVPAVPVSIDNYIPNGDWKLMSVNVKKFEGHYNCCPDNTYPSLNYNFVIERHSATHAATVLIPALAMVLMTLTTLFMNPKQMDRLCLACCNIVVHVLYIESLTWQIPSTGDKPPLLILYARNSLLLCVFSLILTVILKYMMAAKTSSPYWISTIVSGILSNRPGQVLLLYDATLKGAASAKGEEDATTIINESSSSSESKDWHLFARLTDRLSLFVVFITYLCMFINFLL